MIIDGHSIKKLIKYINLICASPVINAKNFRGLSKFSYRDYCLWQEKYRQTNAFKISKRYWSQFIGSSYPLLELPYSFHVSNSNCHESGTCTFYLNKFQIEKLKTASMKYSFSINNIFLGVFCILISQYADQNEFVIGCPAINRRISAFDNMIGMFVKVLPIKVCLKENLTLAEFLNSIKNTFISGLDHQEFDFSSLIKELTLEIKNFVNSLYNIMFVLQQNNDLEIDLGANIEAERINVKKQDTFIDLLVEIDESKKQTKVNILYRKNLFSKNFINELIENYVNLLDSFENIVDKKLSNINILCDRQISNLLNIWKDNTKSFLELETSIVDIFIARTKKNPLEVAIEDGERAFSYADVNQYAEMLSSSIEDSGKFVGVYVDRSAEFILSVLGILFAGHGFIPIDPKYPKERTDYILNDSKIKTLVIQKKYSSLFQEYKHIKLVFIDDILQYSNQTKFTTRRFQKKETKGGLAYLIYTSGSTGNPKGVIVKNKAVINTLLSMQILYPVKRGDSFLFKTNSTFDVSLTEIFGWFCGIGKVIVLPMGYELDPEALLREIEIKKVTHINFVPSMLSALCNYIETAEKKIKTSLQYIFVAGETFDITLACRVKRIFRNVKVINAYGPTEAAIYTTHYEFRDNEKFLPIGSPLPNVDVHVLNKKMYPVPIGVKGELYICGAGLAEGYINSIALSQKSFVKNHLFGDRVLYKTGDIVRLNEDKNIEYIGRQDSQVKIRGYRIELEEIESKIKEIICVQNCAVLVIGEDSKKLLVAFIVPKDRTLSSEFIADKIKISLESMLPSYMVPKYYVKLDDLPINSSGKADKKSLKTLFNFGEFDYKVDEDISFIESNLLKIWKRVLGRNNISVNQSFFKLGGNSLKVIELYSLMIKDYELKINDICKFKTIRDIVQNIKLKPQNLLSYFKEIDRSIDNCYNKVTSTTIKSALSSLNVNTDKVHSNIKSVLLTGSTGYVGNFVLRFLLEHSQSNITVIIRGKNLEYIKQKLKKKLWYYHGIDIKNFDERIKYLQGDISESKLGLIDRDYKELAKITDAVINCAAKVDHFGPYDEFYNANVKSVNNLIDFCLLENQILLHHISTTTIVKESKINYEGIAVLEEAIIEPVEVGKIENFYLKTKIFAELLIEEARKKGLKSNIYRLGNVTFCKAAGKFQQNSDQNAFMRLMQSFIILGMMPDDQRVNFDLSYIDETSEALGLLIYNSGAVNRNFNVINSDRVSLGRLATEIKKIKKEIVVKDISYFYEYLSNVYDVRYEPLVTHLYSKEYWEKPSIVKNEYTNEVLRNLGHKWENFDSQDVTYINNITLSMN